MKVRILNVEMEILTKQRQNDGADFVMDISGFCHSRSATALNRERIVLFFILANDWVQQNTFALEWTRKQRQFPIWKKKNKIKYKIAIGIHDAIHWRLFHTFIHIFSV